MAVRKAKRPPVAAFARASWKIWREGIFFLARCRRPRCRMRHGHCMALTWGQLTYWMAEHDAEHLERQTRVGVQRLLTGNGVTV